MLDSLCYLSPPERQMALIIKKCACEAKTVTWVKTFLLDDCASSHSEFVDHKKQAELTGLHQHQGPSGPFARKRKYS